MGSRVSTDIDVNRAWELYQMKGATVSDVAFSMGTTVIEVRAALVMHAAWERNVAIKEIKAQRIITAERMLFNRALPHLKDDNGPAWEAWLARSKLKPRIGAK